MQRPAATVAIRHMPLSGNDPQAAEHVYVDMLGVHVKWRLYATIRT